jgi:hypothetical protein
MRSTNAPGRGRGWLVAALVVYAALGVVLTQVPDNPFSFGGREWPLDVPVNLVMFAPPAAIAVVLWRRLHPLVAVAGAAVASASIETLQALSPRDASFQDLVLNVTGAGAGAAVGWFLRVRRLGA